VDEPLSPDIIPGCIDNYTLIFAGYSSRWKGGVASIHPSPGDKVYGTIRQLTDAQLLRLDEYEAGYERVLLYAIDPLSYSKIQTYVYIKQDSTFLHYPSNSYLHAISSQLHETTHVHTYTILIRGVHEDGEIAVMGTWTAMTDD